MTSDNAAGKAAPSDDLLAHCITEELGERCKDFDPGCYTCQAWAQYDRALQAERERDNLRKALKALIQKLRTAPFAPAGFDALCNIAERALIPAPEVDGATNESEREKLAAAARGYDPVPEGSSQKLNSTSASLRGGPAPGGQYRKKPVVIEAVRNEGEWKPIVTWLQTIKGSYFVFQPGEQPPITRNADGSLNIQTLEGVMRADVGDWIIRGVKGEFYPCKPDIFEATYEKV